MGEQREERREGGRGKCIGWIGRLLAERRRDGGTPSLDFLLPGGSRQYVLFHVEEGRR